MNQQKISVSKRQGLLSSVLSSTGWPLFWGLSAWVGFYALIKQGVIQHPLVDRYFTGHPIEYAEAALFFVGLAVLVVKTFDIVRQFRSLDYKMLEPIPDGGQPMDEAPDMLKELSEAKPSIRKTYLAKRILNILESIRRSGSADHIDEELKYLAESDADRSHDSYSLVRIIVWATPMLGFLGTVIGITLALSNLSPNSLVNTPELAMEGLLGGLAVAFDTTALAIALAIVLMFAKYQVVQLETVLWHEVDRRAEEEMLGRFHTYGGSDDPNIAVVRRMAEASAHSTRQIMEKQATLWRSTIDEAQQRWTDLADSSGEHLKESLAEALRRSIREHADALTESGKLSADKSHDLWNRLQAALLNNSQIVEKQQQEMARMSEALMAFAEKSGDIGKMENNLNENLRALAGSHNFESTVMSLSAAINLLTSRMGQDQTLSGSKKDLTASQEKAA